MQPTTLLSRGEDFSQKEDLTRRLHGLVRDYPEGIGIFKELIQNADDAGAHQIKFILDWRSHTSEKIRHAPMQSLLGPAMLVFNDAEFTPEDFEGLKNLGEGGKRNSLRKTGRFGLGFNSVYNMTDYPSFMSGKQICFFDPHGSAIPYTDTGSNGKMWTLSEFSEAEPGFMKAFQSEDVQVGTDYFKGTLFRFPFRTQQHADVSKIQETPFTREVNAEPLLAELIEFGEELLLFLKSIEKIKVVEIEADGSEHSLLIVKSYNPDTVRLSRKQFLSVLDGKNAEQFIGLCQSAPEKLPHNTYLHQIQTIIPTGIINSTWRVVNLMAVGQNSELVDLMSKLNEVGEKMVPWAGSAARVASDRPAPVIGKQYCFLPLMESTGLPFHIHGYFDLNSSRQGSTGTGNTGHAAVRSQWNSLLVEHVIVPACVSLVEALVEDIGEQDPMTFYALWPVSSAKLELFDDLPCQFINAIQQSAVIRSNLEGRWVKPQVVNRLSRKAKELDLFSPLTADCVCLPAPELPSPIIKGFESAQEPIKELTPKWIRAHLQKHELGWGVPFEEAPNLSLRKYQWIEALLKYCLSDGHENLQGLPLALLADGCLHRFGDDDIDPVLLADSLQRSIFSSQPHWFIDEQLQAAIPELSAGTVEGVALLSPEDVVECLQLLDCWAEETPQPWNPAGEELPNADWLSLIYRYFERVEALPPELSALPIIPAYDGLLHTGGDAKTPLWPPLRPSEKLQNALSYFQVPLISTADISRTVLESFFKRHPFPEGENKDGNGFVWPLTGNDLIDTLVSICKNPPKFNLEHYQAILVFLGSEQLLLSTKAKEDLDQLPIFPTICGKAAAPGASNVYLQQADTPKIPLNLVFLEPNDQWRRLLHCTSVGKLSLDLLIQDCILPHYGGWKIDTQLIALEWIRANLHTANDELRSRGKDYRPLVTAIGSAALIHCADGELRSARTIYRPGEKLPVQVLGSDVPIPNMVDVYCDQPERWLHFFDELGILRKPCPQDLVNRADLLQEKCKNTSMEAVSAACMRLLYYINEYWDDLGKSLVKVGDAVISLPSALKDKAWLPIEVNHTELKKYCGALTLKKRKQLYRADEIIFVQEATLVASQRPFLRVKSDLHKEVSQGLGFKRARIAEVFAHFDYLLMLWETNDSAVSSNAFSIAVNRVYRFFQERLVPENADERARADFKRRYSQRESLWDNRGNFWNPQHVFEHPVPYFGNRRFGNENGKFEGVYRLLGQQKEVTFQEYKDFLAEIREEYGERCLNEQDTTCVIEVLNRMAEIIKQLPEESFQPDLLLTEDLCLLPCKDVIIPDAEWRIAAVREFRVAKLLHPKVNRVLGDMAGSPSLLRDISERISNSSLILSSESAALEQAQLWQAHLRSHLFSQGLRRLLSDSELCPESVNWSIFLRIEVKAASSITKNLFWGTYKVADSVKGDEYFDAKNNTFYVRSEKDVGIDYLADCLNKYLKLHECSLSDKSKLIRIIEASPEHIPRLLDSLRVRSVQASVELTSDDEFLAGDLTKKRKQKVTIEEPSPKSNTEQLPTIKANFENTSRKSNVPTVEATSPSSKRKEGAKRSPTIVSIHRPTPKPEPIMRKTQTQNLTKRGAGGRSDRWKTVVYPTHEKHIDRDAEQLTQHERSRVEAAGIQHVLTYERSRDRSPEELLGNNPGYDIRSINFDGSIRYIEVKSFRSLWTASGAKLSKAQFVFAQEKGEQSWLYVVERAEDDTDYSIYRIHNPANEVKDFYFDDGWKQISAADNEYADLLQL